MYKILTDIKKYIEFRLLKGPEGPSVVASYLIIYTVIYKYMFKYVNLYIIF